jgi:predicted dehydrogenase
MASKTYHVGIIGYGLSAKVFHIPLIETVSQFKLHAVVQRNPKPEDSAENDHPDIKSYRSVEEMLKDAAIDVVVVTTTPETHFQLTKVSLESGKHGMEQHEKWLFKYLLKNMQWSWKSHLLQPL